MEEEEITMALKTALRSAEARAAEAEANMHKAATVGQGLLERVGDFVRSSHVKDDHKFDISRSSDSSRFRARGTRSTRCRRTTTS